MNIVAKIVGIKYPKAGSSFDINRSWPVEDIINIDDLKVRIRDMLFNQHHNQVLVNYNNALYVCEKMDDTYSRRPVKYHPLESLVKL